MREVHDDRPARVIMISSAVGLLLAAATGLLFGEPDDWKTVVRPEFEQNRSN